MQRGATGEGKLLNTSKKCPRLVLGIVTFPARLQAAHNSDATGLLGGGSRSLLAMRDEVRS